MTGAAGFIGGDLVETLLSLNQQVVGLDNFATGHRHNLADIQANVGKAAWSRLRVIEGNIRELVDCQRACEGVDFVPH